MSSNWLPPKISVPYVKFHPYESEVLGVATGYYELNVGGIDNVETILWLHGSGTNVAEQFRLAAWAYLKESLKSLPCRSLRLIMPYCLPDLFWLNITSGLWRVEDYLFYEILPLTWREATRSILGDRIQIHGYSMGGYAALRLGFKRSDVFKRILAIGPGPLSGSLFESHRGDSGIKESIFRNVFGGSEDVYRRCSPLGTASSCLDAIRSNGIHVDLAIAANESSFSDCLMLYKRLNGLGIDIDLLRTHGVDHRLDSYLEDLHGYLVTS